MARGTANTGLRSSSAPRRRASHWSIPKEQARGVENGGHISGDLQVPCAPGIIGAGHAVLDAHEVHASADDATEIPGRMPSDAQIAGARKLAEVGQVHNGRRQAVAGLGELIDDEEFGAGHHAISIRRSPRGSQETGQESVEAQVTDARFCDPTIQQIAAQWRLRQDMVRAMSRLTLQAKAILRRFCDGDKAEADRLYRAISAGKPHPMAGHAGVAITPLLMAREPLENVRAAIEKDIAKMAKRLPIAHCVEDTSGLGWGGLAAIVGECGDLSAYKSVAAVWKRCGLAVINGDRQRKKSGDEALEHAYAPSRRAVIWTITDSLFRRQSVIGGPYRAAYDAYKAAELAKELTAGHAHNRALRRVSKDLLRDLTVAWRAANRTGG